ncbi:MAG: hypothetical protein H6Q89_3520, partial [Myxococcaceae bacterium]|nr:hypothetical protein [Myxococcaceae bacterium]
MPRLTVVVLAIVGQAAAAAGTVLLVPEGGQARSLAPQIEALLKGAHVRARIAAESSPAVACTRSAERGACLAEAGRGAKVDAVAVLTAAELQGRLAVSLQLVSTGSGAVIADESWRGSAAEFVTLAADPVKRVAAAVKPARAPGKAEPKPVVAKRVAPAPPAPAPAAAPAPAPGSAAAQGSASA